MRIYLMRHGEAVDDPETGGGDRARTLTAQGEKEIEAVAKSLERLKVTVDVILTSPYPRAARTAEIVAPRIGRPPVRKLEALAAGMRPAKGLKVIQEREDCQKLMLVGHNPDLEDLISFLVSASGSAGIHLKKAALATVVIDPPFARGGGKLLNLWQAQDLTRLTE